MAADTIGGGTNEDGSLQNTLVLDESDAGKIDVTPLDNAGRTLLAVSKKVEDVKIGLKGDVDTATTGKLLVNAQISNEAPKGETANIVIANTKTKNLEFVATDKGATSLDVREGKFVKGSITTSESKAQDSINFGATTTINKGSISTGRGADTLTFTGGLTLKGKTIIETGKGKDVVEIGESRQGKGKLVLSDFSSKDKLVVGDETLRLDDIENGDAPKWVKLDA